MDQAIIALMKPTYGPRTWAFTLIELQITICILLVLAAILWPALSRAKSRSSPMNCTNNMKNIAIAFRTWAMDYQDRFPMQVSAMNGGTMEFASKGAAYVHFQVMSNELST